MAKVCCAAGRAETIDNPRILRSLTHMNSAEQNRVPYPLGLNTVADATSESAVVLHS